MYVTAFISFESSRGLTIIQSTLQDGRLIAAVGLPVGLVSDETLTTLLSRTGPSMTGMYGAAGPCHGRGLPLRHLMGGPPAATIAFSTQS